MEAKNTPSPSPADRVAAAIAYLESQPRLASFESVWLLRLRGTVAAFGGEGAAPQA